MAYSGKWVPKNLKKYRGDHTKITYRSNWEKFFFEWLDKNPEIIAWGSETAVIPYFCNAEGKKTSILYGHMDERCIRSRVLCRNKTKERNSTTY